MKPVPVKCCAGGILFERGQVLLGRRASDRDLYPGTWDIIGGHCLPGEELEHTLVDGVVEAPPQGAEIPEVHPALVRELVEELRGEPERRRREELVAQEVEGLLLPGPGHRLEGQTPSRIADVAPTCFWPQPKVTSSMFAVRPRPDHGLEDPGALGDFVRRLFAARRKQLGTILGRAAAQWPEGVTVDLRPEALTVEQIVALWRMRR